jgi:hypothetical protein
VRGLTRLPASSHTSFPSGTHTTALPHWTARRPAG